VSDDPTPTAETAPRTGPRASRPLLRDYGVPEDRDGLLPWPWVRERLREAIVYWVSTTRPDGGPHAAPIWGVWLDDGLWFEGGRGTRRARNLAADPRAVASVHVDDGTALIVEGSVEDRTDPDAALAGRLLEGFSKYRATRWAYEADPANWRSDRGGGLWCLRPSVVLAWSRFPDDATRFVFEGD
jgi:hypothetical protein